MAICRDEFKTTVAVKRSVQCNFDLTGGDENAFQDVKELSGRAGAGRVLGKVKVGVGIDAAPRQGARQRGCGRRREARFEKWQVLPALPAGEH